jgi:hypothetical protein
MLRPGSFLSNHFVRILLFPDSAARVHSENFIWQTIGRLNPMATLHFGSSQPLVPAPTP